MASFWFMVLAVVSRQSEPFAGPRDMINGWRNNENSAHVLAQRKPYNQT